MEEACSQEGTGRKRRDYLSAAPRQRNTGWSGSWKLFCLTRNSNESRGTCGGARTPVGSCGPGAESLLLVGFGVFSMLAAHWNILEML